MACSTRYAHSDNAGVAQRGGVGEEKVDGGAAAWHVPALRRAQRPDYPGFPGGQCRLKTEMANAACGWRDRERPLMRTVAEHMEDCLSLADPLPPFQVLLGDAAGCILAEDVHSQVDVPARNLAAQDGYALIAADTEGATPDTPLTFPVLGDIRTSSPEHIGMVNGTALRISSGAPLPEGATAVLPVEATNHSRTEITVDSVLYDGENVRLRSSDLAAGDVIVKAGTRVGPRQIGLIAAAGYSRVVVHPAPRVVIMAVGDELIEPGRPISPGQVYDADSHAIASAVKDAGGEVYRVGAVPDTHTTLRTAIEDQLARADVVIMTGGLSYAGGDTVKDVLSPLGTLRFDNVAMSPGRQMGAGTVGETIVFCLPGDPAAALIAFEIYVRPALRKMAGYSHVQRRTIRATVTRGWESPAGREEFVPAWVSGNPGEGYRLEPIGQPPAVRITDLAGANCLAVVSSEQTAVGSGDVVDCIII